ncbi:hypothetical protein LZY01_19780 [Levilactobacillus zymae]|uniref:Uncharacterized protein n=1 Tax=Levilactobacillus zymae TaxID=267363 RepID=A0ABQ0WY45_9LACO|nr:hypothetical protein [Levilactobacillus zymae]KRL16499.1 hypothetical protein FD38_GL001351 [Levilactobacillus zymae DSM 19395]QFR61006.1 hypothetical protein LZ395_05430 [Levilactobacillus zymae]GEO72810.1 hypothetical protein LZY01_19780 [Levilactobacillus zymae]
MNNQDAITENNNPAAGVPGGVNAGKANPGTSVTGDATPVATPATDQATDTHPEVMDTLPSISRGDDEEITVDDNFNLDYDLKNGKKLRITVVKPDLEVSTKLSDNQVRINETQSGDRYITVNNLGVYKMILSEIIRVVLVNRAPIHKATLKSLSQIGMTKAELDDVMSIIVTFYLKN